MDSTNLNYSLWIVPQLPVPDGKLWTNAQRTDVIRQRNLRLPTPYHSHLGQPSYLSLTTTAWKTALSEPGLPHYPQAGTTTGLITGGSWCIRKKGLSKQ